MLLWIDPHMFPTGMCAYMLSNSVLTEVRI